jgi:hypothetical protein
MIIYNIFVYELQYYRIYNIHRTSENNNHPANTNGVSVC